MYRYILGSLILVQFLFFSCSEEQPSSIVKEQLWYNAPSANWFEALPIGNGRLGAMVYGSVSKEHLQLNEESLWAGTPEDPYPDNVEKHYAQFQKLNLDKHYQEALEYAKKNLAISPTSIRSYEPLGDLLIDINHNNKETDYKRKLDLASGISTVSYKINGKRYLRESFISSKYDALFYHFKSLDNEPVNTTVTFKREKDIEQYIEGNQLHTIGQIFDDSNGYDDNEGGSGKGGYHMKFDTRIGIHSDGNISSKEKQLLLNKTTEFTIVLSAATDYNLSLMNYDRRIDPALSNVKTLQKAMEIDYSEAKKEHIKTHSEVYNRVDLSISDLKQDTIPTNIRLKNIAAGNEDTYLTQVFFQYGRYLLMSSSGFKAQLPANLQGIWSEDIWARWESDYHLNINLQMNYWAADLCNLPETINPLSNYMVGLSKKGKETAKRYIKSEGWMAHHVTNIFGRTTPSGSTKDSQVVNGYSFPLAGAWMSLTLWRHYEFTGDNAYLKETAYPVLKGAARFILDFLQENNEGQLVTAPSYSPENAYVNPQTGKSTKNTVAATMDLQIIRHLFEACLISEEKLAINNGLSKEIKAALTKLPKANKIGANGTLMEWLEDYEEVEPGHRHLSHLYDLYPGNQITPKTPELFEAAKKTIRRRMTFAGEIVKGGGWGRAWNINLYARLYEAEECKNNVNALLSNLVAPNLMDLYPPKTFQIDGNLGATAGIAEMLLQSHGENLEILPALPDSWSKGSVNGLKARGGFEVAITWDKGKPTNVKVISKNGGHTKVVFKDQTFELQMNKGEVKEITF